MKIIKRPMRRNNSPIGHIFLYKKTRSKRHIHHSLPFTIFQPPFVFVIAVIFFFSSIVLSYHIDIHNNSNIISLAIARRHCYSVITTITLHTYRHFQYIIIFSALFQCLYYYLIKLIPYLIFYALFNPIRLTSAHTYSPIYILFSSYTWATRL